VSSSKQYRDDVERKDREDRKE